MTLPEPPETWREVVRPEWTDYNAHLNLAYYALIFDHATDAFYPMVGLGERYRERTNHSTFAVESHVTYDAEVTAGDVVRCTSQLLGYDDKRIHYFHRMYHAGNGYLAATTELLAVHVDLEARRVVPMPEPVRRSLAVMMAVHRSLPRPEQAGRVIGIWPKAEGRAAGGA